MNAMATDTLRRFMLEQAHVRGEWVHLDESWQTLLNRTEYPPVIKQVLGEALTAAVLLSATIKHTGALVMQIRGEGPINLLVVQATAQGTVRGLAQWNREPTGTSLPELFGQGQMAITLENQQTGERYQSLIPLEGDSLSAALESYFVRSEQLPTRLWLVANDKTAAGILLQRLPQANTSEEDWQRVSMLLDTVTAQELAYLEAEDMLYRLFHEEQVRLFDPKPIQFYCGCSRERVLTMLRSIGQAEAETILQEQGNITVVCEFCNASYVLDAIDVSQLFTTIVPGSDALH